jgi:hypothetical protein
MPGDSDGTERYEGWHGAPGVLRYLLIQSIYVLPSPFGSFTNTHLVVVPSNHFTD